MTKTNYNLTTTEIQWIIFALQHDIARTMEDMSHAEDGSPIYAIGETVIAGRERLITKLRDVIDDRARRIEIC